MAVKILAADDSATMRKVLAMTFAGEAVELVTVESGEAAVERATQSPPDLVIADASMSMSGYEVARALKSNAGTSSVAVIVLASQHHPYDADKGKASGVDDYLLKPYDSQAMINKAQEVLAKPRAAASGGAAAARPAAAAPQKPSSPGIGRAAPGSPSTLRSTVSFGTPAAMAKPSLELAEDEAAAPPRRPARPPARPPGRSKPPARPPARPQRPPAKTADATAAATAAGGAMASKLNGMGLTPDQVSGVLELSREVIERVVWEVVPDLAEVIIKEEIRRLTAE